MTIEELKQKALSLTLEPGVYLMKDKNGEIIYVGKAKALKNRVVSYFRNVSAHNSKTRKMVSLVNDFDYIVTGSEFEALILECSLIKLHSPKYNILLKDDKGYSYIRISDGPFPRLSQSFKRGEEGTFIGPYLSAFAVKQMVEQANLIFKLPTCKKQFPKDFKKARPCLNFYINRCMGLCQGKISEEEYQKIFSEALEYIKGGGVLSEEALQKGMEEAAEALDFEKAAQLRDRIRALHHIADTQNVLLGEDRFLDVWGFAENGDTVFAVVIKVREGILADKQNFSFEGSSLSEVKNELLFRYYSQTREFPKAVLVDEETEDLDLLSEFLSHCANGKLSAVIPKRGERKKLLEMAKNNAVEQLSLKVSRTGKEVAVLEELSKLLGLEKTPLRIESYDISNWGETGKVGGMVVFENGRPLKSAYKRFSIKTVAGQDDYASMKEVLSRRLTRFLSGDENFAPLPDLILLDGGKGHVSAVREVLNELSLSIPLFGMVKDSRHRTRAIVTEDGEIAISPVRSVFTFVTSIQDEVHRYAISYQRTLHKKATYQSVLTEVKGIGEKKQKALLRAFKTKKALKEATVQQLMEAAKIKEETAIQLKEKIDGM